MGNCSGRGHLNVIDEYYNNTSNIMMNKRNHIYKNNSVDLQKNTMNLDPLPVVQKKRVYRGLL